MHADDLVGPRARLGYVGDGQRGRVRGEYARGRDELLDLLEHLVLDVDVLEDGLDHHVHLVEVGEAQLRTQIAHNFIRFDSIFDIVICMLVFTHRFDY